MKLYCGCGCPILVVGQWDGREYHLSLRDVKFGKQSDAITRCPQCGRGIEPGDLRHQRPRYLPPDSYSFEEAARD